MENKKGIESDVLRSLEELINEELLELNVSQRFASVDMFITDGKKSADFIRSLLNDEPFDIPEDASDLYEIAEMRARHSTVTFLIGMVFKQFAGLYNSIPTVVKLDGQQNAKMMWLLTSLYHDKAYFSSYIMQPDLDIQENFSPFLLTDDEQVPQAGSLRHYSMCYPNTMAHTYETILNYDKYAIYYHRKGDSKEKRDHGILGGVMMFKELAKKEAKHQIGIGLPAIKACSLAVAQHNIFKSNRYYDDDYKKYGLESLLSTSTFRIGKEKTLLIFLSLVDTIECVKKFSKSKNKSKYLETLTTLKHIKVSVSAERIVVDLSELAQEIRLKKSDELDKAFLNYKKDLSDISSWMAIEVQAEQNNDNMFVFYLDTAGEQEKRTFAAAGFME